MLWVYVYLCVLATIQLRFFFSPSPCQSDNVEINAFQYIDIENQFEMKSFKLICRYLSFGGSYES